MIPRMKLSIVRHQDPDRLLTAGADPELVLGTVSDFLSPGYARVNLSL